MNLILSRTNASSDGIFGEIIDDGFGFLFMSLERSYADPEKPFIYTAKIPAGEYICKLGEHSLKEDSPKFMTFEVTGVPGHTGILFHTGNYNCNSDGCILLGLQIGNKSDGGKMITYSKQAFKKFMNVQEGVNEFKLKVVDL